MSQSGPNTPPPPPGHMAGRTSGERIYLIDRRGDRFDITHAVERYGMRREGFEYGIGRHAIPPLDHPQMIAPDEVDYPAAEGWQEVIGTQLEGDARSYPIESLVRHEIVNETIGHTQAAVAY